MLEAGRANPDIFSARSGVKRGTKGWDLVLIPVVMGSLLVVCVVAGFDERFHWLPMPDWVVGLGYLLFVAGFALMTWAQAVNRYFEPGVRIQSDRAHAVIDTGPYAVIRHPGYAAAIPSPPAWRSASARCGRWCRLPSSRWPSPTARYAKKRRSAPSFPATPRTPVG